MTQPTPRASHPAWCWVLPVTEDMGLDFWKCNARRFAGPVGGGCSATECWQAPGASDRRVLSEGRCA